MQIVPIVVVQMVYSILWTFISPSLYLLASACKPIWLKNHSQNQIVTKMLHIDRALFDFGFIAFIKIVRHFISFLCACPSHIYRCRWQATSRTSFTVNLFEAGNLWSHLKLCKFRMTIIVCDILFSSTFTNLQRNLFSSWPIHWRHQSQHKQRASIIFNCICWIQSFSSDNQSNLIRSIQDACVLCSNVNFKHVIR